MKTLPLKSRSDMQALRRFPTALDRPRDKAQIELSRMIAKIAAFVDAVPSGKRVERKQIEEECGKGLTPAMVLFILAAYLDLRASLVKDVEIRRGGKNGGTFKK